MDEDDDDVVLAMLAVAQWELDLNFSEFRQAFISPTTTHVLLLSHHRNSIALLLPLTSSTSATATATATATGTCASRLQLDFISDVDTHAWATYGDDYNDHDYYDDVDSLFTEFLFVCGSQTNRGVTVHAFRNSHRHNDANDDDDDDHDDETISGRWVDWGPSSTNVNVSANGDDNNNASANKTWMKSFLAQVDTTPSQPNYISNFPKKQSFPSSASVVSFTILDHQHTLPFLPPLNNYKCSTLFSSNSHCLVGFSFTSSDRQLPNILLVAKIDRCGIRWLSSLKLDQTVSPVGEFVDFCFSDTLLVCLHTSGTIFFYDALSGKFVTNLNLLQTCGLKPPSQGSTDSGSQRMFTRLINACYTSLLAAVDNCGVIYVIHAGDYVPKEYYVYEKLLPHVRHLGLGMMVGWEVGGSTIGHQRLYSELSGSRTNVFKKHLDWNVDGKGHSKDSFISGFSVSSKINTHNSDTASRFMRNVFLPKDEYNENDCICLSPLGITRLILSSTDRKSEVHFDLHAYAETYHDGDCLRGKKKVSVGEAVGCSFQGCFYVVTKRGVSVILPCVSVSTNFLPVEILGYQQPSINLSNVCLEKSTLDIEQSKQYCSRWKVEILDRVLLYEDTQEADQLCSENGLDLKISRIRRLQIALAYLKFDEIEQSLEMLVDVHMAEEGILRMLFAAVRLMLSGNDNEISTASRLLALATKFSTKMIRKYGLLQHNESTYFLHGFGETQMLALPSILPDKEQKELGNSERLNEIARYLEIIRNLQYHLGAKLKKPGQDMMDNGEALNLMDNLSLDETQLSLDPGNANDKLALVPSDLLDLEAVLDPSEVSALVPQGVSFENRILALENPKEMIARWKLDNLDLKTVVKDALLSGRLPLAVLQLHLHRSQESGNEKESHDTFTEVRDIGRAISYDLFLKGETGLAIVTLQRLGEDVETCLKQLLFGTVRRTLRKHIAEEMRKLGYLSPYDWKILERISLIETLYPSGSFWKTFIGRQKELRGVIPTSSSGEIRLHVMNSPLFKDLSIECGEIDGVVLGSWATINENSSESTFDEEKTDTGYWTAAAVWSLNWDQRTFDRVVLDQPLLMGVHVLWDSQLEYHICHNDWDEVCKLLDLIPASMLSDGSLQISLDVLHPDSTVPESNENEFSEYGNYICSVEELDGVCMDVPGIKIFRFPAKYMCSLWLRMLMEQELAKNYIFMKEYWEGTTEIVALLACSGFINSKRCIPVKNHEFTQSSPDVDLVCNGSNHAGTVQALHKTIVHHCAQHNLPNLLDLYIDHHKLDLDADLLNSSQEAAGDCHWARWLLLSRIKGREYDASFSNVRSITSQNLLHDTNLDMDEVIHTVDDIAEGGGEMAALATLLYASAPIQNCISCGSVNRIGTTSAQCTLENLRPTLQRSPTLWRTFVSACFGEDTNSCFFGAKTKNALSDYLNWRESIFFSAGRDTSLLQMLPCWFPKAVRRLIQLYVQAAWCCAKFFVYFVRGGPLGWSSFSGLPTGISSLDREVEFYISSDDHTEVSAISWEATIQKHVEEELYASSLGEAGLGLEQHLHRGRALAAFNHLLSIRIDKLKTEGQSNSSTRGQTNVQSDVQTLLSPITQGEESLLSSVIPLAIVHFEDSMLVSSCAFLLELCGLSANMLRVDVAVLGRISSFYKSSKNNETHLQFSPKGSANFHAVTHEGDVTESLARALADDYLHQNNVGNVKKQGRAYLAASKQPLRALMLVLQLLEMASLPSMVDGKTCGHWLSTGDGDGTELRSQQKAASQHWNLVTVFCQMHQLSMSTKYLSVLARDNDWVGFLSEAQIGGYSFDTVLLVASKEFTDARLKTHIVTVLKGMQTRKKASHLSYSDTTERSGENVFSDGSMFIPVELFRILAVCEKQQNPGEALLTKAKELSWSLLAVIASCFPDASPLSCLTVWLEITAARETSSIKVNDLASQISDTVGAAVEATNAGPSASKALTFHYNRQNPKRRRLTGSTAYVSSSYDSKNILSQGFTDKEGKNVDFGERLSGSNTSDEGPVSLSKMVAVLCEQHLFLPLLRAFEMFLPSCSFLTFIRALQAFSQMRLSEASAHLGSFSARIKEEPTHFHGNIDTEGEIGISWISSTAVKAADATLSTCPSPYEKRCLLQLLAATDFGDGGHAATFYRRLYWKINLAEPSLRKDQDLQLGDGTLDDASLLTALETNGLWEQARNWAKQLDATGGPWKSTVHHVTETQAEALVAEWKEFLWDVPEERVALWSHCQTLFIRYSFPALQAGLFFLKHAEAVEKDIPARELHELLLLSLQWLSGMISQSKAVYPLHLLREIETRVWLLAVESEAQVKSEGEFTSTSCNKDPVSGNAANIIDRTAYIITKMDNHINLMKNKTIEKHDVRENYSANHKNQFSDANYSTTAVGGGSKAKRRAKAYVQQLKRPPGDPVDKNIENETVPNLKSDQQSQQEESLNIEMSLSKWEERVGPAELEHAVLSLMEVGQVTAAKQLQHKLSPALIPNEFVLVDAALKLASMSTPSQQVLISTLDEDVRSVIQSYKISSGHRLINPLQVLESLATNFTEGTGRGLCKRIVAVVRAANVLGLSFSEAFNKQPVELLQLLSLKAQESFDEAYLFVRTHSMPAASIAQILAESFLKGLLAAHRGGYMDSQKEEGPAPLLWRFSDFLKWAELCPSEPEIGHALMRLVITGQEIPHACEVELLILSHHFYKSSACLDGVDVLVALAATRVEAYVSEGDFACLARLITGVGNFYALNFILGILIENGQLDLLLQKYSAAADANVSTAESVRGFWMAVLTSLKHFNPNDLDAFAMVYNHFDMKHETAALLESRAEQSTELWFHRYDKDQNEDLLEAMRYYIEAAEVHSSIDAGNKTRKACAQASLVSLQIRMPDSKWLNLSETNARRALVEQSRFQEALIVAEAYGLNQPSEWALVLWNQMLNPELTEEFVAEFVAVLPLQPSMLVELARFYRAEVAARGDQSQFSVWLTGGGLPAEWAKYLGRSFRCLLKRTRDLRLRLQLATTATGFTDVVDACSKALDKVPDTNAPLVLKKGHGGAYLPLM
ncbi:hypothetical protein ACFE04_021403 [Oxalis oulophora]